MIQVLLGQKQKFVCTNKMEVFSIVYLHKCRHIVKAGAVGKEVDADKTRRTVG